MASNIAGLFLLISGWLVAIASMCLLRAVPPQLAFVFISIAIQILGLVFLFRSHAGVRKDRA